MDEKSLELLKDKKALLFCFAEKNKNIDTLEKTSEDFEVIKCNGIEFFPVYEILLNKHTPKEEKNTFPYNYGIFHNFSRDEIVKYIPMIRGKVDGKTIFATTTPINLNWGFLDLIKEITQEHEEMLRIRKNASE